MNNELYHKGVKGMKWGVRKDDRFGVHTEQVVIDEDAYRRNAKRAKQIRNYLGEVTGHYARNKHNTDAPTSPEDAKNKGWHQLSDAKSALHQFVKEDGVKNSKWISADGKKEVVFSNEGAKAHITTHAEDAGTYNYFSPDTNPLGHAVLDVVPYILFGNSANDHTNMDIRIKKVFRC